MLEFFLTFYYEFTKPKDHYKTIKNKSWSRPIEVPERVFEKISRNMLVAKKLIMINIIENFVADNIVVGTEVLANHPEELPLEIWEFTNFHWVL